MEIQKQKRLVDPFSMKAASATNSASADLLADERDAKFRQWLQEKELRDKAQQALKKLDTKRADDDESFKEVAIAMHAVDRILGTDESAAPADLGLANEDDQPKRVQKSLKSVFIKWASEHYKFSNVRLSSADYAAFSGAVKEFLEKSTDENGVDVYELQSLKYTFPAVPKNKGDKARPLTNDQKQQNAMFMRCLKRLWREVKDETQDRVNEYVSRAEVKRVGGESKSGGGPASSKSRQQMEYNALYDLSMKRLREWLEVDEDKVAEAEREDRNEKRAEAKIAHDQFVKNKDSLRIRLPDDMAAPTNPAMGHGKLINGVKPKGGPGPLTSVELMAGSGLKYVHATAKGRQGVDGDLERSRKQLIKLGHVLKENFDATDEGEFSMEKYHKELEENSVDWD